ncbi:MAG: UDP-N-acetylmuramate--L-alanine ligase [Clostridia bacterium]|nr:UDP-N-acetylmuramate--L-alanine ligase [Clostridia bacterium]MCL6522397.1 UDP-N-acetylmuramate--L-alanine ligase [Bacillota bacterium]
MVALHRVHFLGAGGYGMSALAEVLLARGFEVSGCDLRPNAKTERLVARGMRFEARHDPAHLEGVSALVYTSDVPPDNPELAAARQRRIAILHRSELLAWVLHERRGIAVTGSHGKTTTSSMIGLILERAGLDPTLVIGGEPSYLGTCGKQGGGAFCVAEACESDASFLRYHPEIAVVTNVEPEHLDHYGYDFRRLLEAFGRFLGNVPPGGAAVVNADDAGLMAQTEGLLCRLVTYGLESPEAEWSAADIELGPERTRFTLLRRGSPLAEVELRVPGRHNVANALAAVAAAEAAGVDPRLAAEVLGEYAGAHRRFEILGVSDGVTVVDDYAHHPTEIRATLRAARQRTRGRVLAAFQPQRYTRTQLLLDEFSTAFQEADEVLLADIYSPPGERAIPGVSSELLADRIAERTGRRPLVVHDRQAMVELLRQSARAGDLVITMGAGDIDQVGHALVKELARLHAS